MIAPLAFLQSKQRFLPVTLPALRAKMLADRRLSTGEREQLGTLFEMLAARFHFEFHKRLESIKALYEPFDPDAEGLITIASGTPASVAATPAAGDSIDETCLADAFEALLRDANYVEMQPDQIEACAQYDSFKGVLVRVSLADYERLRVFYRGVSTQRRPFRSWLLPWTQLQETVHVLSRVAVLVRRAGERPTVLKLFKDVVAEDLEMLLPDVRIRMRLLDHLKIGGSLVGGVATSVWKAFSAAVVSPIVFLTVLGGFVGALARSVLGFFSSKTSYMQTLNSRLYFQSLASNRSLLAHVVDAAEEEECKEILLAYFMLYVERQRDFTAEALDRRIEEWLHAQFGIEADFEVDDALRKLFEKELAVRTPDAWSGKGDVLKVYDLPSALRRLDAAWDDYFQFSDKQPGEDRLAA